MSSRGRIYVTILSATGSLSFRAQECSRTNAYCTRTICTRTQGRPKLQIGYGSMGATRAQLKGVLKLLKIKLNRI
jgi:hypothetical protein